MAVPFPCRYPDGKTTRVLPFISVPEDASMETSVWKDFALIARLLGLTSVRYRFYLGANQSYIGAYRSDIGTCRSNIGASDLYQPEQGRSRVGPRLQHYIGSISIRRQSRVLRSSAQLGEKRTGMPYVHSDKKLINDLVPCDCKVT